jgi:hypothetical protein
MEPSQHGSAGPHGGAKVARRRADERLRDDRTYAEINRELEMMLSGNDKIVFGPSEDFEYKDPLEDFIRSKGVT